ncbi:cytochrome c oxidase subunit II [bacterium]|nr:cytochrome c oxidase subunit II [bacterium]
MNISKFILLSFLIMGSVFAEDMSLWQRIQPPEDISINGHHIDWLFNYTTVICGFFFLLVCIGLFGFSWKYSEKRSVKAIYTYGNKKVHSLVILVIGAAVFFGADTAITVVSNNAYKDIFVNWPGENEDVFKVQVMAQQWAWNFRYAGPDGTFNTDDDIISLNDLRIPNNKKVVIQMISKDVIHSLFLPNIRRKVDAIPGRVTRIWFQATKPGVYDIACAEMCGTHHYKMKAKLTVYNQEDFNDWQNHASLLANVEANPENPDLYWGWKWMN